VAYTEALQTVVLVVGSMLLTCTSGFPGSAAGASSGAVLEPDLFNLWKPLMPAGVEGTWAPVLEAGRMAWYFNTTTRGSGCSSPRPIIGLWYWCTDQYIVQRARGSKRDRGTARHRSSPRCLKLLPVFIFIIPGMIAIALARTGRAPGLEMLVGPDGRRCHRLPRPPSRSWCRR
jgi:solute:Na+ symporter, SSS family